MSEKILQGVPSVSFASGERFTPIGALKAVATFLGLEVTYPFLMGCSGAAFRVCWSDPWSLEMTYAAPQDLVANGARAVGLATENHLNEAPEEVWEGIGGSLDGDLPVLSCGLAGAPEFCIITGYQDDPRALQVQSYFEAESSVPFQPWTGWHYGGYGQHPFVLVRKAESPEGPLAEEYLRRALDFARGEGSLAEGGQARGLHFGVAAYDAWRGALDHVEGDLESKAFNLAVNLNALTDARRTAGEFLQILGAVREDLRPAATRAADHYRHQVSALAQARKLIYYPFDLPAEAASRAAEELADEERRAAYVRLLKAAKAEELLSLEWIEKAVAE